jgi:hypothetical protein
MPQSIDETFRDTRRRHNPLDVFAMSDPDDVSYLRFTGPQQRDKALSDLQGILRGIAADGEFRRQEVCELRDWQIAHDHLMKPRDFQEVSRSITLALQDGRLERSELDEMISLCDRASSNAPYFDAVTQALQELFGFFHGILADRIIKVEELKSIMDWMDGHNYLSGIYPFTEIEALVVGVLQDKVIDEREQKLLQAFFSQFVSLSPNQKDYSRELELSAKELCVDGVCAVNPDVKFDGRMFCFTGFSAKGPRKIFAEKILERGGIYHDNVVQELNYLVIGADGNPAWAYSCYGRKVEAAMRLRKKGCPLLIVHESDFWDAAVV